MEDNYFNIYFFFILAVISVSIAKYKSQKSESLTNSTINSASLLPVNTSTQNKDVKITSATIPISTLTPTPVPIIEKVIKLNDENIYRIKVSSDWKLAKTPDTAKREIILSKDDYEIKFTFLAGGMFGHYCLKVDEPIVEEEMLGFIQKELCKSTTDFAGSNKADTRRDGILRRILFRRCEFGGDMQSNKYYTQYV